MVEDSKCSGDYCVDLGGNSIGSVLIVSGAMLAIVSVIASEVAHDTKPAIKDAGTKVAR